jgi:hypothetical protein
MNLITQQRSCIVAKAAVGRPGLEPPPTAATTMEPLLSPPRPEVEEEEEKGGWRRKKEEAAPLRCGAGFATDHAGYQCKYRSLLFLLRPCVVTQLARSWRQRWENGPWSRLPRETRALGPQQSRRLSVGRLFCFLALFVKEVHN